MITIIGFILISIGLILSAGFMWMQATYDPNSVEGMMDRINNTIPDFPSAIIGSFKIVVIGLIVMLLGEFINKL